MAKDLSKYQQNIVRNYYENRDTIQLQKLSELVTEIWLAQGGAQAGKLWDRAGKALLAVGLEAAQVARIVRERQPEALAALVRDLDAKSKSPAKPTATAPAAASAPASAVPPAASGEDQEAQLKRAFNAFKKKLKNMRLDDESGLGGRYTTRGQGSGITAITPPRDFPEAVWKELARQGRLKAAGQGLYQLP